MIIIAIENGISFSAFRYGKHVGLFVCFLSGCILFCELLCPALRALSFFMGWFRRAFLRTSSCRCSFILPQDLQTSFFLFRANFSSLQAILFGLFLQGLNERAYFLFAFTLLQSFSFGQYDSFVPLDPFCRMRSPLCVSSFFFGLVWARPRSCVVLRFYSCSSFVFALLKQNLVRNQLWGSGLGEQGWLHQAWGQGE